MYSIVDLQNIVKAVAEVLEEKQRTTNAMVTSQSTQVPKTFNVKGFTEGSASQDTNI